MLSKSKIHPVSEDSFTDLKLLKSELERMLHPSIRDKPRLGGRSIGLEVGLYAGFDTEYQ